MIFRDFLLGAICVLAAQPYVSAQARTEDPRAASNLHVGALYLKPGLDLKEFGIDTNVFNDPENPEKDFTFTIAPQLTSWLPFARRGLLQLFTSADLVYYQQHDSERSLNPNVSLRAEAYFNRLTLFAKPSYLRTRARPNLEIDKRSLRVEQGTIGGAEIRVLPKLALEITGQHLQTTYDADESFLGTNLAEMLNRDSVTVSGSARWAWTPLTTFIARGEAITDRFLISPIRDADSVRVMGGAEFKPRALISGDGYVGVRKFEPVDQAVDAFTGVVASAALRYTLLGSTVLGLNVSRDVNYSFEPQQPYYLATGWGVQLQRHLAGRFDALAGLDHYKNAYRTRRLMSQTATDNDASDVTDTYSGSIGYRVGQDGRFGVGLVYWRRNSNRSDQRDYKGFRFKSSFTYGI